MHDHLRTPGLPVDVWDATSSVWRPSVVAAITGGMSVLVPAAGGSVAAPVGTSAVRISQLIDSGLARHWAVRCRLMLFLALTEDACSGDSLRPVVAEEFFQLAATQTWWRSAFRTGARPGEAIDPAPLPPRSRELVLPYLEPGVRRRAATLLAGELRRLHRALLGSGWSGVAAAGHPVVGCLAALLLQAGEGSAQPMAIRSPAPRLNSLHTGSAVPLALSTSHS
ncbi:MAG: hypothetical protein JOY68_10480 [Candidatus Dormibacteraeota bacterium]|nr:hypothetical protein [Candidatus Dormibacteraeota bacterium]